MVDVLTPGTMGDAAIEHFTVSESESRFSALRPGEYVREGRYARLRVGRGLMMTDTHMERITNYEFLRRAQGDVLVGGLGLGMIVVPACAKKEVRSVTVLELSADVIGLVEPQIRHEKLTVVRADVRTWRPPQKYQTIYFDIWPTICVDNLREIATLHRRYAKALDRSDGAAWMSSWQVKHLRALRRRDPWR